jgi:hydrogenase maturation protein HypF
VTGRVRRRVRVEGVVQGVGFRPFVHALAARLGLTGRVGNDAAGVLVEVEGDTGAVGAFLTELQHQAPPLAVIERVAVDTVEPVGDRSFVIDHSDRGGRPATLLAPDIATCADCLRELFDPTDRRYRYPFTNCTNCGPRFTIIRDVPYDRPSTTMASFPMCADCAREYHDPADRRFHAQPVCCPICGPALGLVDAGGTAVPGEPIEATARLLRDGAVVAVKGLGGYHLAALAGDEAAVAALRSRKHREDRPFAVMAADLDAARTLACVDAAAAAPLTSPRRPIVVVPKRRGAPLADAVAPRNRFVGVMLPYTPLHHLLARSVAAPFVLTSGNVSDEPIAYRDDDALGRLAGIADAFLTHNRSIHARTDDSVVRVVGGQEQLIRRSRGYVPQPLRLPRPAATPILAVGAELKHTFCLVRGEHAFLSHHIGDLENYETYRAFTEGVEHFSRLFGVQPGVVAHDLHPEYLSTKYALERTGVDLIGVQHHHAHIASCLVDNRHVGPVIGVAFDGLGYGTDATLWGGEVLVADLQRFERVGHLEPVPMPGGTTAIREPWRMAAAYLDVAYDGAPPPLDVAARHGTRWADVVAVARSGMASPVTSSAGRLFDAVAAVVGVRDTIRYEGQAAVELEQLADPAHGDAYEVPLCSGEVLRIPGTALLRAVVDDLRGGLAPAQIAARFHNGLAVVVADACSAVAAERGLGTVALSGGVFQNQLLTERLVDGLQQRGLAVLTHRQAPPNDGGISLGQAAVAAATTSPLDG